MERAAARLHLVRIDRPRPARRQFSGVARRPYDQKTYGTVEEYKKIGWSNYNGVQLEIRRQYAKGYGFQLFYTLGNAMIAGGNGWSSDLLNQPAYYLPGTVPTETNQLNRFLNYRRDTGVPQHRVQWNWIADLPMGRGKKFFGNAGGVLDRIVGGWQIAGFGNVRSNYVTLGTGYFGLPGKLEVYGKKYPIQDCRSGTCYAGYLWFNGYIPANRINSYDSKGKPNGVMGVPADYKPAFNYIINMPASPQTTDPLYSFYDSNTVWVPMKDGNTQRTTFDNGLNAMRNQFIPGPRNWGLDASLFKSIRVNERLNVRFNADFFNVLNMPSINGPDGSSGIISLQKSYNDPRQLQLTLRLQW